MLYSALFLIYLVLVFLTFIETKKIKLNNLSFIDGVLIGLIFYISLPLFFIFIKGELFIPDWPIPLYNPEKDIWTTINLFIGWITIILIHSFFTHKPEIIKVINKSECNSHIQLKAIVFLYLILSIYSFIEAGMLSSSAHWHLSVAEALTTSPTLIIAKNFAFAYRTSVFGLLFFMVKYQKITIFTAVLIGLILVIFDLITTFNRVTIVYLFILIFLIYIKRWRLIALITLISVPIVAPLSDIFTTFRSTNSGYSIESFVDAYSKTLDFTADNNNDPVTTALNSIFEASNLLIFSGIVNNIGNEFPVLWGETFLIRPLTTFIPSAIWPEKPHVFGTYLGKFFAHHDTLSLNSTLFGEALGNFYYFWPFALILSLSLINIFFIHCKKLLVTAEFMGFFLGFGFCRFDLNFAISGLYSIILLWIFVRSFRLFKIKIK